MFLTDMKTVVGRILGILFIVTALTGCEKTDDVWSHEKLKDLKTFGQEIGTTSFMLITDGKIVASWGDLKTPTKLHSARKAILSAMVGQHQGLNEGEINLQATLEELGIDDYPEPLSQNQKQVKVIHLLKSISGINHTASAETPSMTRNKTQILGTEENDPGTVWAYNNWDYNTLTSIFEQETGKSVLEAFRKDLAEPLGMRDFRDEDVFYVRDSALSTHSKVGFALSARDMAKFGLLYLQKGIWKGEQLIPEEWITRITSEFSFAGQGLGSSHGYLWWVPNDLQAKQMGVPEGTYIASGYAGQRIVVIPAWNSIFIHKVNTNVYDDGYLRYLKAMNLNIDELGDVEEHFYKFIELIAAPGADILKDPELAKICKQNTYVGSGEFSQFFQKLIEAYQLSGNKDAPKNISRLANEVQLYEGTFSSVDCVKSCLEYMGHTYSDPFIYGSLGYAFILHVNDRLDPIQIGIWDDIGIYRNAELLGANIETIRASRSEPDFDLKQEESYHRIMDAIDQDCPAMGFNLFYPKHYLITGYDHTGYYFKDTQLQDEVGPKNWKRVGRDQIGWMEFRIFSRGTRKDDLEITANAFGLLFSMLKILPTGFMVGTDLDRLHMTIGFRP